MTQSNSETSKGTGFEDDSKEFSMEFYDPYNVDLTFIDTFSILYSEDRFILNFFQVEPPLVIKSESGETKAVKSKCMVRMVVTPKTMTHLYNSLEQVFKAYQTEHGERKDTSEDSNV